MNRREALAAMGLGVTAGLGGLLTETEAQEVRARVNTASEPSNLRITDLRVARLPTGLRTHVVRIDTNQGISGLGEIRDGASPRYALMLKSRILGENPCNVDKIFRKLKQFGHHGRQAGGVVAIEMACWDLAGQAWGVPCWQMLGGRFRDRVRMYADTPTSRDAKEMGRRLRGRREQGFTFLKMDFGINLLRDMEDGLTYPKREGLGAASDPEYRDRFSRIQHPFTGIRITDRGLKRLQEYVAAIRDELGWDVPLAADHFGHMGIEDAIKLAQALDPFNLAWLEDMIPWFYTDQYVRLRNSCNTPILTGEDIYLKEGFLPLFENKAIAICHPDLMTSGGLLETKKIGDLAMEHGISMALHMAGSPVGLFGSVHCAAATENFLVLEHHDVDTPNYDDLIDGISKPIVQDGFVPVPEGPGLGITLNEEAVKQAISRRGWNVERSYFPPSDEWNDDQSHDRLWSRLEHSRRPAAPLPPCPNLHLNHTHTS
jgi:L-alanine-DL-glutamate epimerase-like enolase superfamily enzyme